MLSLPTPDRERELRRLTRALNLADRYRLHFAQSDVGEPRRRLIAELQAVVEGPIDVVELNSEIEHLRMHLSERYGEGEWPRVVMVTGIENWLPAGVDGESSPFVQNLNASRDLFRKLLRGPMVIWGAEHVLRAIQHGVPDFFSVASGLYLFPGEASAPLRSLETPGATFSEVARRLEELAELDERLPRLRESDREDRARLLARKVTLLTELARFSEAEAPMREALALAEGLPEASPTVALVLNECAQLLKATNRLREAEPLMRRALEIDQANHGSDHPNVARDLNNLAQLLKATNRLGEAEPLMRPLSLDP
jgi:tetratricopeptide (TPR) repeat protein